MTVNAAAKRHKADWRLVNALVVAWAGLVASHRRRRRCRVLRRKAHGFTNHANFEARGLLLT